MELDNKVLDDVSTMLSASLQLHKKTTSQIDDLYARLGAPDSYTGTKENRMFSGTGWKTAGQRLIEQGEDFKKSFGATQRFIFQAGQMFCPTEQKSTVDSAAVGFATAGVLSAQRVSGIVPGARRRLTIRDLLRTKPVSTGLVDWPKESSFTSNASPQTESSAKAESTFALTIASARVSTIAHYVTCSRQVIDDLPGLREYVDGSMLYYLRLKEETELLTGDGLGSHQSGLITQATSYAGTYAVAADTVIDKLFHFQTELAVADETCNFYVLNPIDWSRVNLVKTDQSGANTGVYLVGDPNAPGQSLAVPTLWGCPVIVTRSIPSGKALAGDSNMAFLADRMDATIDFSINVGNQFIENKITILAENRVALCVTRPGALRYGSI